MLVYLPPKRGTGPAGKEQTKILVRQRSQTRGQTSSSVQWDRGETNDPCTVGTAYISAASATFKHLMFALDAIHGEFQAKFWLGHLKTHLWE